MLTNRDSINKLLILLNLIIILIFSVSNETFAQSNYEEFLKSLSGKEIIEINIKGIDITTEYIELSDYLNYIQEGEPFIFSRIQTLFRILWNTHQFEDIQIKAHLTESDKVILTIIFIELPKVSEIIIEGNIELPTYIVKRGLKNISENKALRDSDLEKDIKNLIQLYKSNGITGTNIIARKIKVDDETNNYKVIFYIFEGQEAFVESIQISGNTQIQDNQILRIMETKQSKFYDIKRSYNPNILERDKANIIRLYREHGFLDAEITDIRVGIHTVKELKGKRDIKGYFIEIDLDEGEQYIYTGLDFENNKIFTDGELSEQIKLNIDEPFNDSLLNQNIERIIYNYYEKGYLYTNITPILNKLAKEDNPESNKNTVSVTLYIYEGDRAHIEEIIVVGSDSKPFVVDRLFELQEGDIFNLTQLLKTRENLINTGYFTAQETYWQLSPGSEPGLIKLIWYVQEERLRSILFNAAYDFSGSLSLSGDLQLVNFIGNGWDFSFKTEVQGFDRFTVSSSLGTNWLFQYTPIRFRVSGAYSINNVRIGLSYLDLDRTPEGYIGTSTGYGPTAGDIDLNSDGVVDNYDSSPIDLNNDGVINEDDMLNPVDLDGDGTFSTSELYSLGLSYQRQSINFGLMTGYEFIKGFESYISFNPMLSTARMPIFGDPSTVNLSGIDTQKIELSNEQINLLFGNNTALMRELIDGWQFTLGITLGVSWNYTKIGALSASGPLATEGWRASMSITPYFFARNYLKYKADIMGYFTILPWNKYDEANLIFAARAGIEVLGPLGENIISYNSITPADRVGFDGLSELRGFYNIDRPLMGYSKWIVQMELRGPVPAIGQFLWWVPFFMDWGNIGYNPQGYDFEFGLTSTPIYDPQSGDLQVGLNNATTGHKFSVGFGFKIIQILPLQIYFAWPFEFTEDGVSRVIKLRNNRIETNPYAPVFVITGGLYF